MLTETERLLIRPWRHDEAERMLDILSRVEVAKWLGDGEPVVMKDLDEAHQKIDRYVGLSETPPLGAWAVEVRDTGVIAGSVLMLEIPNGNGEVEIGWHLHPDSHGAGYATEAATALLANGFAHGLTEIHALTHTTNWPSQAVCKRLGMTDLGEVEKWYDDPSRLFLISAKEFASARA